MNVQQRFEQLVDTYSGKKPGWADIERAYSGKGRHYHTLDHLETMFQWADQVSDQLDDREVIDWAIFYHDIIYNVFRKDNEEQSAAFAKKVLADLGVAPDRVERCVRHIQATQLHQWSGDPDCNYLLDMDLGILGSERERYEWYTQQIRKEYRIFPDLLYKPGRKKVLEHFLGLDSIYKTEYFRTLLEEQARNNLKWELSFL